jgi:hypothetical protein
VALNWAAGVTFHHKPLPLNKKTLLEEHMDGRAYRASVMIANMQEYRSSLKDGALDIPALKTPPIEGSSPLDQGLLIVFVGVFSDLKLCPEHFVAFSGPVLHL